MSTDTKSVERIETDLVRKVARIITLDHLQLLSDFDVDGDLYRLDPECAEAAHVTANAILEVVLSAQSYTYIGNDGKPVLARDLEDERDAATARVAELERLVRIGDVRCDQCALRATTIDSAGDAACAACAAKEESRDG